MTQTLAIFYDAYRSLNAKKMFWIVLAISVLVVAAFAAVGINDRGLKILVWQFDTEPVTTQSLSAATFYKYVFVNIGIGVWLTWLATILALISTAGIFPDLVTGGSIGLLVSKPIGRLRLFLTEYAAGLLFVTLQVTVFCLASFLVIGLRGGDWEPGLFMAVPVVVCFFSYLFAMCAFLGIFTRSTLASLLLTLLFWFGVYGVGAAENTLLMFKTLDEKGLLREQMAGGPRGSQPPAIHPPKRETQLAGAENEPPEEHDPNYSLAMAHRILYGIKTVLPKTTETIALLDRELIDLSDLPNGALGQPPRQSRQREAAREMAETLRGRSIWWIVGTSLGFEAIVLAGAALIFCRRDF
jgi:ABC-type transport system involved in multi-copper enzyme maturation permease subunit